MKKGPLLNNNSRKFTTRDSLGIESVAASISRDLCPIVNTVTPRAFYWAFMVWIYYDFYNYSGIKERTVDVFDKNYLKRQDYFFVLSQLLTEGSDQINLVGKQNSQDDINKNPNGPYVFNADYFVSRYGGMQYYNAGCITMDYIRDVDDNNKRFSFPKLTTEGEKMALEFQSTFKNTEYYKHYRLNDVPVPKDVLIEYGKAINIGLNGFESCKYPKKASITRLTFSGSCHTVTIECQDFYEAQEIEFDNAKWLIRNAGLNISLDDDNQSDYKYVVFKRSNMSIGIPLSFETDEKADNRFYSTYYIKADTSNRFLPTGMIIDTTFANIHRNDLGDSEKAIEDAYHKIQEEIIKVFQCMCSQEISSVQYLDDISNAFHYNLYQYLDADRETYEESPFNIIGLDNQYLPKISGSTKSDIVVHEPIENYQKSTPLDSDSVPALTALYFECIERGNVVDYNELVESDNCLRGVSMVYELIASDDLSENYKIACEILHFFPDVAGYITYIISGERREEASLTDSEIDYWLSHLQKELGDKYNQALSLKLIGRYKLNAALAFDGSLKKDNLSFKDYLFNGIPELANGVLSKWQNQQYDGKYSRLKRQLLRNRFYDTNNENRTHMIRYMEPRSTSRRRWDGKYDYYGFQRKYCNVSDANKFIMLERIALDSKMKSCINNMLDMWLFERRPVQLRLRDDFFAYYRVHEQQIVCFDFLRLIQLEDFGLFLQAVDYRKRIKEHFGTANLKITCHQPLLYTHDIVNTFLSKLISLNENTKRSYLLSEYSPDDVIIDEIQENTNNELPQENREFIFIISGYKIHVSSFDSDSKNHVIAYFGNGSAKIELGAKTPFKPIAKYLSDSNDIYIFYDNVHDINRVVSPVLKELNLSKYMMELLHGYIHNGNDTKTMNYLSRRRTFARVKKRLVLDWADFSTDEVSDIEDIEVIYRLLTARGSYDIYCPICADIPLETFDYGEDTKTNRSRKIMVLENENPDTRKEYPYIITVACSYCFEKLRHTLSKSEFDGKRLTLTTQIAQGQHEKMKSRHQLELSPVNILLMKKIKFRRNSE